MRFTTLTIRCFMSFGEELQTVKLDATGLVLVEGENRDDPSARSNGSGKSALLEALLWCLYGVTVRGYEADDVINRKVGKNCHVIVTFFDDHGVEHDVKRFRKHDGFKNGLYLDAHAKATQAETQADIDHLLGMSAQTFMQTVVFGQSAAYRFSMLTDKEQKTILDEALGTEMYARAGEMARDAARDLTAQRNVALAHEADFSERVTDLTSHLEELRESEKGYDEEKVRKVKVKHAVLLTVEKELAAAEKKLESRPKLESQLTVARANIEESRARCTSHETRLATLKSEHESLRIREKEQHEAAVEARKQGSGLCRLCGGKVTTESLRPHLLHLENSATDYRKRAVVKTKEIEEVEVILKGARNALTTLVHVADKFERETVQPLRILSRAVEDLEDSKRAAEREYEEIKVEKSPFKAMIAKTERELVEAKEKFVAAQKEARTVAEALAYTEFWVDGFGPKGVRALLIDSALPLLNGKAAEYANTLTDGAITVEFKTQSTLKSGKTAERFEVAVTNAHGAESYKGNSAGEKAKIDLIVGLALQALVAARATAQVNLAFFDEVFESLDSAAAERVITLLSKVSSERESMFVITHNEEYKTYFPAVMTVVKEDGESRIE